MIRQLTQALFFTLLLSACGINSRLEPDSSMPKDATGFNAERPSNPSCLAFERPEANTGVRLQRVFSAVSLPEILGLIASPQGNRFYAVQKNGLITTFAKSDGSDKSTFLDLRKTVNASPQEAGLLGMAFHPTKSGEFYLSYTVASSASRANLRSVIARFRTTDGLTAVNQPEILLTQEQPFANHNGGNIVFGPDGYLYIGFGDGGSGGDPKGNGQKLDTLLGKVLRIDVNSSGSYSIPKDNPFIGKTGAKPEIFTYGMRNTWRFNFDKATGDLWAGDVGQDRFEEIDLLKKGGNYGWNVKEGFSCFANSKCTNTNIIDPVFAYGRSEGASVTGGFVYRGKAIPDLVGIYIFGDFVSGNIWSLLSDQNGKAKSQVLQSTGLNLSSFAQDNQGELYALDYGRGGIYQLVPNANSKPSASAPARLSETGCFETTNAKQAAPGLIPYEVNSPLWSDGAAKRRWMALPDGSQITVAADGHFNFPIGSVLVKEFSLDNKPIETRLFVLHSDAVWAGYTYEWNADGKDANLVANGAVKTIGKQTWQYPSQAQCLQCHNSAAGFSLGLELGQLNRSITQNNEVLPQLAAFEKMKLFTKPLPNPLPQLPPPTAALSAADASRSYLQSNCSFCHRPGGTGGGALDLRYETPLSGTGLCNVTPSAGDLGLSNARLLAPGAPERSVLLARLRVRGTQQMPPLASNLVDTNAQAWLTDWIQNVKACN